MSAIASPEFVSLCQAQLRLLTQQVSGSSVAIYIADMAISDVVSPAAGAAWDRRQRSEPNFVPVVSYPESIDRWVDNFARATGWAAESGPLALLPSSEGDRSQIEEQEMQSDWPQVLQPDRQLVVPLVYADVVVGLMVAIRRDRPWDNEERHYIESVAQSLAAGCVLERRSQWLQSQMANKRDLQSRQSEIFHNLLHQFRNPLTAVTTFGQLLVRRLEPEDPNQKIATGIVRESKRLREMVAHFDETVAIGDADLAQEVVTEPAEERRLSAAPRKLLLSSGADAPTAALPDGASTTSPDIQDEPTRLAHEIDAHRDLIGDSLATASSVGLTLEGERAEDERAEGERAEGEQAEGRVPLVPKAALSTGLGHPLSLCAQYLPDIVEPILAVASIVALEKAVTVQAQVATDTPMVWGEEEALREVVSNLVDNAVKYSPCGAQVWVQTGVSHTGPTHHYQGIVVGDTGPGIPPEDLVRLFERNYRGVQAEGDIPGTGLGLAIAQSLMTQMQGTIEVISPAAGTPWMPASLFKGNQNKGNQNKGNQNSAPMGPGTVFIVWLREAESL